MISHRFTLNWIILIVLIASLLCVVDGRRKKVSKSNKEEKQLSVDYESRETNTPNFVRLVVMRLIYGIAAQMGLEERLASVFNGAFVPPNADEDDYGGFLGDFGDGGDLLDF